MAGSTRHRSDRGADFFELRVFLGRDSAGKVRHRSSAFRGSRRAAERELARLVAERDRAPAAVPTEVDTSWGPTTTVNDAIEGWRANGWDDLSPSTIRRYASIWKVHIKDSIGSRQIAKLSPYDVERYLRDLKAEGLSEATVRQVRAVLHRSCRLARRWSGGVLPNPVGETEMPEWSLSESTPEVRSPSVEEVCAILTTARSFDLRLSTYVRLVAATGARRGEACALRWSDVDWESSTIRIDEALVAGAGGASARGPKTRASVRSVAVDAGTIDELAALRQRCELVARECALTVEPSSFVFSSEAGGSTPPHPDTLSHAFAKLRVKAGVAEDIHLHSLRHFQSTELDKVISETQKQSRLGWATVQMARHYTDAVPAEDRRAAEHIGRLLSGEHGLATDRANDQPPVTLQHPSPVDCPRGGARQRVAAPANGRSA
ncbi:MAG: tyrosine-type recombinase/integrase [Acidimicrobiales bacterium]